MGVVARGVVAFALAASLAACVLFDSVPDRRDGVVTTDGGVEAAASCTLGSASCPDDGLHVCAEGECLDFAEVDWVPAEAPNCRTIAAGDALEDQNTGLFWERATTAATNLAGARAHCDQLNARTESGFDDWRVPTRIELSTLTNPLNPDGKSTTCGPAPPDGQHCTQSFEGSDKSSLFYVFFPFGHINPAPVDRLPNCWIRCVRRAPIVRQKTGGKRFVDVVDGVLDKKTNLVWEKASPQHPTGVDGSWKQIEALDHCNALIGKPWFLPTLNQLLSITNDRRVDPAIDVQTFPGTIPNLYVTRTPAADRNRFGAAGFWTVGFENGSSMAYERNAVGWVRCVRQGP